MLFEAKPKKQRQKKQQQQQQQHHALRGNRSEQMLPLRQMFQWAHVAYSGTVAHERAAEHCFHAMIHHRAGIGHASGTHKQENHEG